MNKMNSVRSYKRVKERRGADGSYERLVIKVPAQHDDIMDYYDCSRYLTPGSRFIDFLVGTAIIIASVGTSYFVITGVATLLGY